MQKKAGVVLQVIWKGPFYGELSNEFWRKREMCYDDGDDDGDEKISSSSNIFLRG